MTKNFTNELLVYAGYFLSGDGDQSATELAESRGWLNETGEPTPLGREIAAALIDQHKTRSAFRIG